MSLSLFKKCDIMKKETKAKLDKIFSLYIRLRDSNKGRVKCPLCGKVINWKEAQNMHFIKRSNMKYRYSEENCYAGCVGCNVYLNGNYQQYTLFMIKKFWQKKVEEMINDKGINKVKERELEEKIIEYVEKCKKLCKEKKIELDIEKIVWKRYLDELKQNRE